MENEEEYYDEDEEDEFEDESIGEIYNDGAFGLPEPFNSWLGN